MSALSCQVDIPQVSGLADQSLSVGREFYLVCHGEFPANLNLDHLSFELSPSDKYSLKLLGFEKRNPTQADLKVTSYLVGGHQLKNLILTDGSLKIDLGDVQFQVASIQDPARPRQEPYGPMGPLALRWPLSYWLILAALVGMVILIAGLRIWRKIQRQRWLSECRSYDHAMGPMSQAQAELRKIYKKYSFLWDEKEALPTVEIQKNYLEELRKIIQIYLIRRFQVRALLSDRVCLTDFKKYHRHVFAEFQNEFQTWQKEMQLSLNPKADLKIKDLRQLYLESRKLIDLMDDCVSGEQGSKRGV